MCVYVSVCVCVCECVYTCVLSRFSHVQLFVTLWIVACQGIFQTQELNP